jgi:hypothetical protein
MRASAAVMRQEELMEESDRSLLFTSDELAIHIVDTLVDRGLIDKARFEEAVGLVKWELDAQHGIGRVILRP